MEERDKDKNCKIQGNTVGKSSTEDRTDVISHWENAKGSNGRAHFHPLS